MSAFGPLPEGGPDFMVDPFERLLRRAMSVIIGPATNGGVQQTNQQSLTQGFIRVDDSSDFLQGRVRVLLGRFIQRFAVVCAESLSEEVEPLVDMGDAGLVGGERQPLFLQELLHHGPHIIFQQFFRVAGNDEVVRESHKV